MSRTFSLHWISFGVIRLGLFVWLNKSQKLKVLSRLLSSKHTAKKIISINLMIYVNFIHQKIVLTVLNCCSAWFQCRLCAFSQKVFVCSKVFVRRKVTKWNGNSQEWTQNLYNNIRWNLQIQFWIWNSMPFIGFWCGEKGQALMENRI